MAMGLEEQVQGQAKRRKGEHVDDRAHDPPARARYIDRAFEIHHFRYALTTSITSWLARFCSEEAFRPGWTT